MLLFDNNLSLKVSNRLAEIFTGCKHVIDFSLGAVDDLVIWNFAKENGLTIVTKDKDFEHLSNRYGNPPKVIWIRIGNATTQQIIQLLIRQEIRIKEFIQFEEDDLLELL